jgi:hypothetical protein
VTIGESLIRQVLRLAPRALPPSDFVGEAKPLIRRTYDVKQLSGINDFRARERSHRSWPHLSARGAQASYPELAQMTMACRFDRGGAPAESSRSRIHPLPAH